MSSVSITKSIISISSPGVSLDPSNGALTVSLARQCNDFAAGIKRTHPNKFGFWASIPLPNVPASLDEMAHALDDLGADGIGLLTNYHGHYLGSKDFEPIFAELNRREATVFVHPSTPCIAAHEPEGTAHRDGSARPINAAPLAVKYPSPMFEFLFDSTRAVLNLFFSGTIARYPDIQYIIPHAGAALPPLIERNTRFNEILGLDVTVTSQVIRDTFARQFSFDLAGLPFPDQIHGLLRFVDPSRLLYGSDYPFTPGKAVSILLKDMDEGMRLLWSGEGGEEKRRGVWEDNAKRLLERNMV